MSDEKWPTQQVPYHSTTKRDGWQVPFVQTVLGAFLYSLIPLLSIPLWWFLNNWFFPALPVDMLIEGSSLIALATFVISARLTWNSRLDDWMNIIDRAMTPGDANANGIPDALEAVVDMLMMDGNGDGVPDLMDILNRYNGGSATLYVTVSDRSGDHVAQDELPYAERLPDLARKIDPDKPLTYRAWGFGRKNGCLFDPPEWAKLTAALEGYGYAQKQNPNAPTSSIILTEKGRAWRAALVEQGGRIERETGRRAGTYTDNFLQQRPLSPSPAD